MNETNVGRLKSDRIRTVHRHDRDWGMPKRTDTSAVDDVHLTAREKAIMIMLLAAIAPDGTATMLARVTLKTSDSKMQELFFCGWVNGAGTNDTHGQGNTPESSWWWLTTHGEQVIRAIQEGEAQ